MYQCISVRINTVCNPYVTVVMAIFLDFQVSVVFAEIIS